MRHRSYPIHLVLAGLVVAGAPLQAAAAPACFCPQVYDPVVCLDGSQYSNMCEAQCDGHDPLGPELVVGGDFGQDYVGCEDFDFSSALTCNENHISAPGLFVVDTDASYYHAWAWSGLDHTDPNGQPPGAFMIVNGSQTAYDDVWCQTHALQPDTWYTFSTWAQDLLANPNSVLGLSVDGDLVTGEVALVSGWSQLEYTWKTAPSFAPTVNVEVCVQQVSDDYSGNDYGIDDVSLRAGDCWSGV